ncbi:hypothetical protein [Effusibacillus dendaii]|uniref:Uncharacterized protein n=1 Tax=Effusibacillus dendaii TaxID=2743772 RepID=A0A7I8DD45_9BACL|nr:hypothetical protein [Effusibacillus dendaii]BCJ86450.1 hypothetical protein skT53_14350 [Effusibacillus dendaii]
MSNLADVRVKSVQVTLDKERSLLYDLNAFAELEDKFGSIDETLEKVGKGSIKALRAVLWAGLLHEDESLTEKQVGKLITLADLQELSTAVNQALTASMPQVEKKTENPPEK